VEKKECKKAFRSIFSNPPNIVRLFCVSGLSTGAVVMAGICWGIGFSLGLDRMQIDPAAGAAPLTTVLADTTGITLICIFALLISSDRRTWVSLFTAQRRLTPAWRSSIRTVYSTLVSVGSLV